MVFFAEILGRKKKKKLTKKEKTIWNIVRFQYTRLTYRTVNEKLEFEIKTVYHSTHKKWASLMAQQVKNPPVMLETQNLWFKPRVRKILGMRKMAAHSIILAWKIPWTEEPGGLQSTGSQRVRHDWALSTSTHETIFMGINLTKRVWFIIGKSRNSDEGNQRTK